MKADSITVQDFFHAERRHLVPLYQRPYVWKQAEQWEPLWDDLRLLAERALENKKVRPHFLGAVVLEQIKTGIREVPARLVIDGQQRLTTLQVLMGALRELCAELQDDDLRRRLERLTRNEDADPASEQRFKVWPTNLDRAAYSRLMGTDPSQSVQVRLEAAAKDAVGEGLIVKAFGYFAEAIRAWLHEDGGEKASARAGALVDVIRQSLQLVVIDLGDDDEAQVIFETLNARGTPLLPADLVKNYLFQSAAMEVVDLDQVYAKHWESFDKRAEYWRKPVKQGRFFRPQIDLFLQHYLTLLARDQVSATHLFSEFKEFVATRPEWNAERHLQAIHRYATVYERFSTLTPDSRQGVFFYRLGVLETTTLIPFLLGLFERFQAPEDAPHTDAIVADLESFLVRRMVCRLTTKNYNKFFLSLVEPIDEASSAGEAAASVRRVLLEQDAESTLWPKDSAFTVAWLELPAYRLLTRARLRMILEAIEAQIRTDLTEAISLQGKLTVEHLMPQAWEPHWPLPPHTDVASATTERNQWVHRFGNLTLLTKKLNPSISNSGWTIKHPKIMGNSALALNRALRENTRWDEETIERRNLTLLEVALRIWPRPTSTEGGASGLA
jgi:hypothetical protein